MTEKTLGIVLRRIRYNDTGVIADIFTHSRGAVSFAVKAAKSGKGRTRMQLLSPLNLMEVSFRWRQEKTLQHIDEMQSAMPFSTLQTDPIKTSQALFIQEFLYHALKNEVRNEPLFRYLRESLLWLDKQAEGCANFHIAFIVQLTKHLGIEPYVTDWKAGRIFDLKEGIMTDEVPAHRFWIQAEEAAFIPQITRMTLRNMRFFRLNRTQRNAILDGLITYYRLHVPEFPELKSLEILREVFKPATP